MSVYDAFWKLSTCRSYGMTEGPIPWTAIHQYGESREMGEDEFYEFEELILAMDRAYLKIRHKPTPVTLTQAAPPASTSPVSTGAPLGSTKITKRSRGKRR